MTKLGTAWRDITPDRRLTLAGQMHVRYGEYTHDPLTVNAMVLQQGKLTSALVSCDLLILPDSFIAEIKPLLSAKTGIPAANLLMAATHTHAAPNMTDELPGKVDPMFIASVKQGIVDSVIESVESLEPVKLYAGSGYVEQMGFNRRGMHKDGSCDMYYGAWNEDFAGLEGPRDGEVGVIFACRQDGSCKAVITSFSTHPNSLESQSFYSADLVGSVRNFLRKNLGDALGFVYLTGAAGNTAPTDLVHDKEKKMPWRGEEGWHRSGQYLGSEILKTMTGCLEPMTDPVLMMERSVLKIPLMEYPQDACIGWQHEHFESARRDWQRMLREENPVEVPVSVLRIGDAAICTNPAELYVEHGLQIKEASPASPTLICELADGYVGYVATTEAYKHGGYSTWPAKTCKLSHNAGDLIVEETARILNKLFQYEKHAFIPSPCY